MSWSFWNKGTVIVMAVGPHKGHPHDSFPSETTNFQLAKIRSCVFVTNDSVLGLSFSCLKNIRPRVQGADATPDGR